MGALDPALQLALAGRGGRGAGGSWEKVEECAKSFPDSVEFLQTGQLMVFLQQRSRQWIQEVSE